jgi:trk system potassium uptake protein TrkH
MTAVLALAVGTFVLLETTALSLETAAFEAVAAFSPVGLSTGAITALPGSALLLMGLLMFAGLVGPITLGSVLALRQARRTYRLPEARPIVG